MSVKYSKEYTGLIKEMQKYPEKIRHFARTSDLDALIEMMETRKEFIQNYHKFSYREKKEIYILMEMLDRQFEDDLRLARIEILNYDDNGNLK